MIVSFKNISMADIAEAGGKVASLGEMIKYLTKKGLKVPGGFCVTATAFRAYLRHNNLYDKIQQELAQLDISNIKQLQKTTRKIKTWINAGQFPADLEQQILKNFKSGSTVAVRSSATCEDLPTASFAGLHETFIDIKSKKSLLIAIKAAFASLYNERAISYRSRNHFSEEKIAMAVGVQNMVASGKATSGVMFTLDTESGFDQVVLINAVFGQGEGIVSGKLNPDEYVLYKPNLEKKRPAVLRRKLGNNLQKNFCLTDQEMTELGKQALQIEQHFKKHMDIEWAKDARDGKIYIVQARPETVKSAIMTKTITEYKLLEKAKLICQGTSVGSNIGQGKASIISNVKQMKDFKPGSVLVTDITDPDWEPIMKQASAIVTNRGGRTCHAAIIARELGIPAVVGTLDGTKKIKNNQAITVSCAEGEQGKVYNGLVKFERTDIEINKLPKIPVKLSMNLGNPEKAFQYQFIPNDGIGLARLEFIISNSIGIHPNALIQLDTLPAQLKKQIKLRISAYASPTEFYIEKLREGMATLAAAFYPKEVIFRFSDFKTNEYKNLLGGVHFEPDEENPMLGFRGASRYVSELFSPCFALECEALKRVRHDMGLKNAQAMIPFTRTVSEAEAVVKLINKFGLKRGIKEFKLYMMCEIPSNAILAENFLEHFDGFSIGSNDLTQLSLGIDRDSELIAPLFDERNDAVKHLLKHALTACNKAKKYVGICGQGPSDYPDFAKWLVDNGINSLSLNPDSIIETWLSL